MLVLKILLYYFAALCIFLPIITAAFRVGQSQQEAQKLPPFPWDLIRKVFVAGIALLTAAVILTLIA